MAHYVWTDNTGQGQKLRSLLNDLRGVLHAADDFTKMFAQMSDTQVAAMFAFADGVGSPNDTVAGAAKGEIVSDLGKLLTDSSQTNVFAALNQLLAEFA